MLDVDGVGRRICPPYMAVDTEECMTLDARDEVLFVLWCDGKISYEDALRYSTSVSEMRLAIKAEERRRRDDDSGRGAIAGIRDGPKTPPPWASGAALDEEDKLP